MMPHRSEELSQPLPCERATSNAEAASNHNESDNPEHSIPLADLETMDSQLFDLEFPVLMDLDQPENEPWNHEQDTVMTDVFNSTDRTFTTDSSLSMEIQNTINMDPSWPPLSDQDWLWQNPEMDLASLPTEYFVDTTSSLTGDLTWQQFNQNGMETLQAQEHRPSYHDLHASSDHRYSDQFGYGIMPESLSTGQTGFTSHAMFQQAPTTQTELVEQQQHVYDQEPNHSVRSALDDMRTDMFAYGPVIQQRPLPPVNRGGRSGRMSSEEAREQYMARQNGVCARCWWLNKKVLLESISSN
ncbi:hypothetical protein BKA59DRAFT_526199 [Fusarium tricinctum]|uniref:Uncharacterized protein n=1 Tax=Fusarium tricinctum TaxID=61284 RepID=A0A8K0S6Y5_9HYPO|nr:hypothetical protein BKA59DRAFT_526199 [Fusarium tricinctum]